MQDIVVLEKEVGEIVVVKTLDGKSLTDGELKKLELDNESFLVNWCVIDQSNFVGLFGGVIYILINETFISDIDTQDAHKTACRACNKEEKCKVCTPPKLSVVIQHLTTKGGIDFFTVTVEEEGNFVRVLDIETHPNIQNKPHNDGHITYRWLRDYMLPPSIFGEIMMYVSHEVSNKARRTIKVL